MTNPAHDLHARIDRLERENRRMRRIGGTLLAGVSALALMSFTVAPFCKTVTAERLVVHDHNGTKRMVINAYSTETPTLTFKDKKGKDATQLSVNGEGEVEISVFKEGKKTDTSYQLVPKSKSEGVD